METFTIIDQPKNNWSISVSLGIAISLPRSELLGPIKGKFQPSIVPLNSGALDAFLKLFSIFAIQAKRIGCSGLSITPRILDAPEVLQIEQLNGYAAHTRFKKLRLS